MQSRIVDCRTSRGRSRTFIDLPSRGRPDYGKTAGRKQPEPVPEGFDYDLWLGPAPYAAYCPARTHVNFRWVLDYSGGQLTDWGGHHPDCAQWGMGTQYTGPVGIRAAEVAHRSITICHLGNIAMQLGIDGFRWDPDKEEIVNNPEAARMLARAYREPWVLPG